MGINSSKGKNFQGSSKYGQIFVQSDKRLYHGGETVTGNIHMNIVEPFPGTKLCLKFTGKQQISYVRTVSAGKGKTRSYLVSEKKNFLTQIADVYSWSNDVTVGQYTIPFSFLLPNDLPPSFNQHGNRYRAYVLYKIEAFLEPTIPKDPKLKYKQAFIIRAPLLEDISRPIMREDIKPVFGGPGCYKCYKRGSITIKTNFDKGSYAPGETLKAEIQIDNSQSLIKCQKLFFYLKPTVTLKAKDSTFAHGYAINHKEFPGIEAGAPIQTVSFEFRIPPAAATSTNVNKTVPTKGDLRAQADDQSCVGIVCTSNDITSKFSLEVCVLMEGYMMNFYNIITIDNPINIIHPEPEGEKVVAPDNWNPQVMNPYTASFTYPQFGAQTYNQHPNQNPGMISNQMISPRAVHPM